MTKELEYLEELKGYIEYFTRLDYVEPIVRGEVHQKFKDIYWNKLPHLEIIEKALLELKAIKEAKPSEAIECSLKLYKMVESAGNGKGFSLNEAWKYHNTIKQALLKVQKLEKLEEEIGCPLEVRCKLSNRDKVFVEVYDPKQKKDVIKELTINFINRWCFMVYTSPRSYEWKDYKKTWWLLEDKSE